jgi:hypothetical protein
LREEGGSEEEEKGGSPHDVITTFPRFSLFSSLSFSFLHFTLASLVSSPLQPTMLRTLTTRTHAPRLLFTPSSHFSTTRIHNHSNMSDPYTAKAASDASPQEKYVPLSPPSSRCFTR